MQPDRLNGISASFVDYPYLLFVSNCFRCVSLAPILVRSRCGASEALSPVRVVETSALPIGSRSLRNDRTSNLSRMKEEPRLQGGHSRPYTESKMTLERKDFLQYLISIGHTRP
jgi:hypothetical protein